MTIGEPSITTDDFVVTIDDPSITTDDFVTTIGDPSITTDDFVMTIDDPSMTTVDLARTNDGVVRNWGQITPQIGLVAAMRRPFRPLDPFPPRTDMRTGVRPLRCN